MKGTSTGRTVPFDKTFHGTTHWIGTNGWPSSNCSVKNLISYGLRQCNRPLEGHLYKVLLL